MASHDVELIGPLGVGKTFAEYLGATFADPKLEEATLASAFLTIEVAELIVSSLRSRTSKGPKPVIRILIGTMLGWTRKAAIQYLLGLKGVHATLNLLQPQEPHFHVKAVYARAGQRRTAAIGSHNATGDGLMCLGELGLAVEGAAASSVARGLEHWVVTAKPWSKELLKNYKERKRLPKEVSGADSGKTPGADVSLMTAPTGNATVKLTKLEEKIVDASSERLRKERLKEASRYLPWPILFSDETPLDLMKQGYLPWATFDYPDKEGTAEEQWKDKTHRHIYQVGGFAPAIHGKTTVGTLLLLRQRGHIPYTLNPDLVAKAKKLGITKDGRPDPKAMHEYIEAVFASKKKSSPRTRPSGCNS